MKTKFFILALLGMMIAATTIVVSCSEDKEEEATLTLSGAPNSVAATSGTYVITVTSNSAWTAKSSDIGIATVVPANGNGNGTISVLVTENTTAERTVDITVAVTGKSQTATIIQVAAGEAVNPTLDVTAETEIPAEVSYEGATYTVSVTANSAWTVTSTDAYIADVEPATGLNNGTFLLTVKPNATVARAATISVTTGALTETIGIAQAANPDPIYITPRPSDLPLTFGPAGVAKHALHVTSNCTWTPIYSDPSIVSHAGGSTLTNPPDGTIEIAVSPNPGSTARTATVTLHNDNLDVPLLVTQEAPALTVSPTTLTAALAAGSTYAITVTSNTTWTVASGSTTVATVSPANGNGPGAVTVTVSPNTDPAQRTAKITFTTDRVTPIEINVTQNAAGKVLTVNPEPIPPFPAASSSTYAITVTSNTTWTVESSDEDVATVEPKNGTSTTGAVTITVSPNVTSDGRAATITFTTDGVTPVEINVTQAAAGKNLSVDPTTISAVPATGNTYNIAVTSNVAWTVGSSDPTITLDKPGDTNNGAVTVTVPANTYAAVRNATITFSGADVVNQTVSIAQLAADATLSVADGAVSQTGPATGTTYAINVTANGPWTVATTDATVATASTASGAGDGSFNIILSGNPTTAERGATITVTAGGKTSKINVAQEAGALTMQNFTPTGIEDVGTAWSLVDNRDQKVYSARKMAGGKIWMTKNIYYTEGRTFHDNKPWDDAWWETIYYCYEENCEKWGAYYSNASKAGVCPTGWALPDPDDWANLYTAVRATTEGKTNADVVAALGTTEAGFWTVEANNSSGFNGIASGSWQGSIDHVLGLARMHTAHGTVIAQYGWGGDMLKNYEIDGNQLFPLRCVKN